MTELPLPSLFLVTSNYLFQIDDDTAITYSKFIIIPFLKIFPNQQYIAKYSTSSFLNAFAYYILNFDKNNLFDIQSKELDDMFISLELFNLLAQLNFQNYIYSSIKPIPNSKLDLNELVINDVIYKMVRMFAGKIKFIKYHDRHLQYSIYWFLRFNQYCSIQLEDNILHNFQYLHYTNFMLDFTNFAQAKKTIQGKQSDKEKADTSATKEIIASLQNDLTRYKLELVFLTTLIRRLNINRDNSNIDQFLPYVEVLIYMKNDHWRYGNDHLDTTNYDLKILLQNYNLTFHNAAAYSIYSTSLKYKRTSNYGFALILR